MFVRKLFETLLAFALIRMVLGNSCTGNRNHEEYDYIIVGAGSTGSVIANRLSEKDNMTVLLIEAGGPPPEMSEIPLYSPSLSLNQTTEWGYYIEPQEHAFLAQKGKKILWSQYKALGGCSIHNEMLYVRGSHKDYDNWMELGASGWNWNEVLRFFKMSEDYRSFSEADNVYRGTKGFLTVSPLAFKTPLSDAYLKAGDFLGYQTGDYNGASQTGFFEAQLTQRDGRRCSTEKAFLRPAAKRANLDILDYAEVVQLQFDGDKRARNVSYIRYNNTCSVTARREIILSAGAIGSARLLLLSGIGPKEQLMDLEIPLVADLPVGQNLQNHVFGGVHVWNVNYSLNTDFSEGAIKNYTTEFQEGKGPLTSPSGIENLIFTNTKYDNTSDDWPDIQIISLSSLALKSFGETFDFDATILAPVLLKPKSRGYLKLRSKDPQEHPFIDPMYLTHEDDLPRLLEGMKFCRSIIKTPPLQAFDPNPVEILFPSCQGIEWESDEYLLCVARTSDYKALHICGTAKMGDPSDNTTVVDPELRVKGVKGLRVADASVMPAIVTGNINAACIMIGEKAANMISG